MARSLPRAFGQHLRVSLTSKQSRKYGSSAQAENVRGHAGQFQIGTFQRLLQAIGFIGSLLDQCLTIPANSCITQMGTGGMKLRG